METPIQWMKLGILDLPCFVKNAGDPFFIIGEDANTVLFVTEPARVLVHIFELWSETDIKPQDVKPNAYRELVKRYLVPQVVERMKCLLDAAKISDVTAPGKIIGVFRDAHAVSDGNRECVICLNIGLGYTTDTEFKLQVDDPLTHELLPDVTRLMSAEELEDLGLPIEL